MPQKIFNSGFWIQETRLHDRPVYFNVEGINGHINGPSSGYCPRPLSMSPYCRDSHPRNCREIGFGSPGPFLPCALVGVRPFEWRLQESAGGDPQNHKQCRLASFAFAPCSEIGCCTQ